MEIKIKEYKCHVNSIKHCLDQYDKSEYLVRAEFESQLQPGQNVKFHFYTDDGLFFKQNSEFYHRFYQLEAENVNPNILFPSSEINWIMSCYEGYCMHQKNAALPWYKRIFASEPFFTLSEEKVRFLMDKTEIEVVYPY